MREIRRPDDRARWRMRLLHATRARLVNAPLEREAGREGSRDRSRLRRVLLLMLFVSLTLAAIFGRHGVLDVMRYRAECDRLAAEIAAMEAEQARLEAQMKAIGSDPSALERIAREELSMAKPGEAVVLLQPAETSPPAR